MDLNEKKALVESIIEAVNTTWADAKRDNNQPLQDQCEVAINKAFSLLSDIEGDIADLDSALGRVTL